MGCAQQGQLVGAGHVEVLRVVHALAGGRQVRPFEVDAEQARHAFGQCLFHRRQRFAHHLDPIADQGRQETGGAVAPVGRADAADRLHRRCLVEQHAATAVDLHVDEARQQHGAGEVVHLRGAHARIGWRQQVGDTLAVEQHG